MILTERDIHPLLEMNANCEHCHLVEVLFTEVKQFSLCWLAEEELELRYPDQSINNQLNYNRNGNTIEIIEKKTNNIIAKIRFNSI